MSSLHQGFQETDGSADIQAAFSWLDGADGHPLVQQIKQAMLGICPVPAGARVLDVGCGLGHEARRLAELAGPHGKVSGIDSNPAMIAEARRRAEGAALPCSFDVGDAVALPFPDGAFDLCRTERVLRYMDEPLVALEQMRRVTRTGGSVIAFDFDSDQTVVDAADPVLARRIADALDAAVPHPWIGRQLHGLFLRAGLRSVRVVPHAISVSGAPGFAMYQRLNAGTIDRAVRAGALTAAESAAWWAGLERAAADGTFFSANLGFIAAGEKA